MVTNRVPLVVTYNPAVQNLRKILNQYHPLLHTSSRCKEIFSSPPLITYRRGRNLTQILTSKRLHSSSPDTPVQRPLPTPPASTTTECDICGCLFNTNRALKIHRSHMHKPQSSTDTSNKPGFWPCKQDPHCACCKCYGVFKETITSTATNETITLKQHTNCNTANVIYLLTCVKCKQQYVGETANAVHVRANQHRSDIAVGTKQLPTVRHFRNCGRKFLRLTITERVRRKDLQTRLARENYWIQRLKPVMNTLL